MSTAHKKGSEYMPEYFDDEKTLEKKCKILSDWIRESEYFIAFTGAGISTSCGIPDFRGPDGAWTLKAQGKKRKKKSTSVHKAVPSRCHMALVELMNRDRLKYIVSQNCDGLHVRSGIDRRKISELHGNTNLERCKSCRKEYLRDFRCRRYRPHKGKRLANGKKDHATGRLCGVCNGELRDTMVAFGEYLDSVVLGRAENSGKEADLCLVLGSSCTVSPANDIPKDVARRGKRLVIVNLQKTPINKKAKLVIHGKTDDVMFRVMNNLGFEIPEWYLRRKILVRWVRKNKRKKRLYVAGLDSVDLTFFEYIKKITVTFSTTTTSSEQEQEGEEEQSDGLIKISSEKTPHCITIPKLLKDNENVFSINLEFFGHYYEPDLVLQVKKPHEKGYIVFDLSYDVKTRKWKVTEDQTTINQEKMKKGFKDFLEKLK